MSIDRLKTLSHYALPKYALTSLAGFLAGLNTTYIKNRLIRYFLKKYQVNMNEALIEDPYQYACFNDFFIRRLKKESRPLANADLISPVDGCVSELGPIVSGQLIQAKGKNYSVSELLAADPVTVQQFEQGQFATLYLSPKDYHRVHMPIEGLLLSMTYVPGALFSVQPRTARAIPKLFARNERLVVHFATALGPMVIVMVGATIVGSIATTWHGEVKRSKEQITFDYTQNQVSRVVLDQGEEIGFFKLGSTVVLLFAAGNHMSWDPALHAGSTIQFGQTLGSIEHAV